MAVIQRHYPLDQVTDEQLRQAIQILTTEHFNLQTARSATISEAVGRLSTFLTAISGVLIALGFAGQVASFGTTFKVFTLVLLPALLLLGITTCARVAQTSMEDIHYLRGISRIRHFYVEVAPEIADYFVGSIHDDAASGMKGMGLQWSWWQPFLSIVNLIAMVNSIIAGVLAALIIAWTAGPPGGVVVITGLVVGLVVFGCHFGIGLRVIGNRERVRQPMFPAS
jgi:hypothetical protein